MIPRRPLVAVLGGAKVADKIAVIERFLGLADALLIGGAMCFPFLAAEGHAIGASLCEADDVEHARHVLARAADCRRRRAPRGGRAGDAPVPPARSGDRRGPGGGRARPGARRRRGARRLDGSRHRPRHRGALRRGDRGGGHGLLERADGRVRAGAVRRRHARGRRGGGWRARARPSSAAATRPPRWCSSGWRTPSTTCRPAAARRSS